MKLGRYKILRNLCLHFERQDGQDGKNGKKIEKLKTKVTKIPKPKRQKMKHKINFILELNYVKLWNLIFSPRKLKE